MNPHEERISKAVIFRFAGCLRPYLRLVVGAALMGVGKFTLPLAFPLVFKYVIDVLLTSPPKFDSVMRLIDRTCIELSRLIGHAATPTSKLAALSIMMLLLYAIQSIAS